jgi:hypothetical protein
MSNLPDGEYLLTATLYDMAGNTHYQEWTLHWGDPVEPPPPPTDETPPTLTITGPANGSIVPRKSSFAVTATATDEESGVDFVRMQMNDSVCIDSSQPYSCRFSTTGKPNATYRVNIYTQDKAGNKSAPQTVTVKSASNRK